MASSHMVDYIMMRSPAKMEESHMVADIGTVESKLIHTELNLNPSYTRIHTELKLAYIHTYIGSNPNPMHIRTHIYIRQELGK